jgi:protein-disulfide isomerase
LKEMSTAVLEPLDEGVDHLRGALGARTVVEYGDYGCPYSRLAYRRIENVQRQLNGGVCFAFRHFPLTEIHPHAQASSAAAEAAALQGRFWEMHDWLFHHQKDLEDEDLRGYANALELDV